MSFARKFSLPSVTPATLHLFADTRYRLWINGNFVAYGPARFVTSHPEYDSHDITGLLRKGENVLRVEVNYYGTSSFQTMPDGLPGFIAAGGVEDGSVEFTTPGDWTACIHRAWDAQAPSFSFAQNPAEICDTRVLTEELAGAFDDPVEALPGASCPWPKPVPRTAPYPDYALFTPVRLLVSGPLNDSPRWGLETIHPAGAEGGPTPALMFATWIHSPRDQQTSLDCFWADLELNGQRLTIEYPKVLGNHGQAVIHLRKGWNCLAGSFALLVERWSFLLGLPRESEASLHALPDLACPDTFAVSPVVEAIAVPAQPDSPKGYVPPAGWKLVPNEILRVIPSRLTAWDTPKASACRYDLPAKCFSEVATHTAAAAVWSYDFADEYYGHPVLEVEAPAGSILDIAYDDWKRPDGCAALYFSNFSIDAADRFVLRGGRQRIEVLNPRAGIYLQVVLRVPEHSAPAALSVHEIAVRRRTTIRTIEGTFACGDPILDWAWRTSVHTLQASTDEGYADSPWRERGSYIGDSLVNLHLNRLASTDLSMARRTLSLMGQAQLPDGQLACCAPAWLRKPHEDFTLLWIQAVRDVWAYTGDVEFLARQWPVMQRIWSSPTWKRDAADLWDSTGMRVFTDWGVIHSENEGAGNSIMNILRVAAARNCAEIASVLNLDRDVKRFDEEAERITAALLNRLWNQAEGRFNPSIGATTPALHANIFALRYGIGPAAEILAYLEPKLRQNFAIGRKVGEQGYAELYFFHYLLPALAGHGRFDLAEALIHEHYGFIKTLNYPTLPEGFAGADLQQGSCCHSWSGAAAIYGTKTVLGLRQAKAGEPDAFVLDPVSPNHSRAEGSLPHPQGVISVKWERTGDRIRAHATVPKGVTLSPATHVDLTL